MSKPTGWREMPWGDLPRPAAGAPGSKQNPAISGVLVVDKPSGVTSHDVVGAVRRLAGTRKVGHAGTLDPMATGVLTIGIGAATRLLTYLTGEDKTYRAKIRLGAATSTEDADGEILVDTLGLGSEPPSLDQIREAMQGLTGEIMQRPSAVSAIKVDGKRSYELAREGKAVELEARPIVVSRFELLGEPKVKSVLLEGVQTQVLDLSVEVDCSAGTYIRALARDLGEALGVGAHLTMLRRTRVGGFKAHEAHQMADLAQAVTDSKPLPITPLARAVAAVMPTAQVSDEQAKLLRNGQFIELKPAPQRYPVALIRHWKRGDDLVAIAKKRGKLTAPEVVFPIDK